MREKVKIDGVRVCHFSGNTPAFIFKLADCPDTGSCDRLISGHDEPPDPEFFMKRCQHHDQLDSGAIRIGNDFVIFCEYPGVDLRDNQRDILVHSPGR